MTNSPNNLNPTSPTATGPQAQSEHILYEVADQEPRHYEYNLRFKIKALKLIRELPPQSQPLRVLDFGCGRGEFLKMLTADGYTPVGVDFDPVCVEMSSKYACARQASIENVRDVLGDEQFDVVTCLHVLEHMDHPRQAVANLQKLSRRWLIFAVPNLAIPTALARTKIKPVNRGHTCGWDAGHFSNFLEGICGLKIIRWIPDVVILPKISRLAEKLGCRRWLENEYLPRKFPFLSTSLIALCEIPARR